MNIAFDATAILGPMSKNRGIGNYALNQFKAMINQDDKNNYFFINFFEEFSLKDYIKDDKNLIEVYFDCGKNRFLLSKAEYKEVIGGIISNFIKEYNIDVFYITSPFDSHVNVYEKEWFEGVRTVATVYDIIPYVFKDIYLGDKATYKWYMSCIDMLRWVDQYLVISNSVKEDMIKYLNFEEEKIEVIYGAVDETYTEIVVEEAEKVALYKKFNINSEYIMCTGGDDGRKNIDQLIIAYGNMPQALIEKYQLVIVCKLSKSSVDKYTEIISKNKLMGRVILTNFVSAEELLKLYNLATLMAFPSKYEGFGLPIVEAWACGTPVLTSKNSSLGEIGGNGAITVDPFDVKDITRGLVEALANTDLKLLLEKGKERLQLFQWDQVAQSAISYINRILPIEKQEIGRKKIAFFSPLPPIQSGISDYSVDILNELINYFEIDVFIDDGYKIECYLNKNIKVYMHKEFKNKRGEYFDIIYQMGNSYYHEYMYSYIKKYRGTVVLHDYNMHSVAQAIALYKQNHNLKLYREYLAEDFNSKEVDAYLQQIAKGQIEVKIHEMELNGFITNYADKIIVHSDYVKKKLLERDLSRDVQTIYHYARIEPLKDSKKLKRDKLIDENEIVIASFGHIHETKRALPILKAFNRLTKEYEHMRYIFVGKLDDGIKQVFNEYVNKNQLGAKVTVTGYTTLEEFESYIDLVDICLNLRYPYNGETSGSLMRILSKGKCVVINDIGSFSEIPDKCCEKLPSVENMSIEEEVEKIYEILKSLVKDEAYRNKLSKKARNYAEQNLDIRLIGEQYKEYILKEKKEVLTNELITHMIEHEIKDNNYTLKEIKELSKTLASSKSGCKNR